MLNRHERRKQASGKFRAKVRKNALEMARDKVVSVGRKIRYANFIKKVEARRALKAK